MCRKNLTCIALPEDSDFFYKKTQKEKCHVIPSRVLDVQGWRNDAATAVDLRLSDQQERLHVPRGSLLQPVEAFSQQEVAGLTSVQVRRGGRGRGISQQEVAGLTSVQVR